jgi:phosphocarrier protein
MKTFDHVITNPVGIHARPAGNLVKFAKGFDSDITITNLSNGKSADAKKLFALLGIAAKCQDKVTVTVEGSDEDAAFDALQEHFALEL